MVKSTVVDNETGKSIDSTVRTSTGTFFARQARARPRARRSSPLLARAGCGRCSVRRRQARRAWPAGGGVRSQAAPPAQSALARGPPLPACALFDAPVPPAARSPCALWGAGCSRAASSGFLAMLPRAR